MKVRWMLVALLCMALLPAVAMAQYGGPAPIPQDRFQTDHDWEHHDWEHDQRFAGHGTGYRWGYRDGFTDGHRDRDANRKWHYGPGFKHPDRGYHPEYGDKHIYMQEYREAYENGYREGYGERH
jgi:hypothetical protein